MRMGDAYGGHKSCQSFSPGTTGCLHLPSFHCVACTLSIPTLHTSPSACAHCSRAECVELTESALDSSIVIPFCGVYGQHGALGGSIQIRGRSPPPPPPPRRQIQGNYGDVRLVKICAGGTFGELGFYLLTPQPFRALAREDCHLHTLDRDDMAKMQVELSFSNQAGSK